jgi:hypothetical protein
VILRARNRELLAILPTERTPPAVADTAAHSATRRSNVGAENNNSSKAWLDKSSPS